MLNITYINGVDPVLYGPAFASFRTLSGGTSVLLSDRRAKLSTVFHSLMIFRLPTAIMQVTLASHCHNSLEKFGLGNVTVMVFVH